MQPKTITVPVINYELTADWYEADLNNILFVLPGWTSNRKNYRDLATSLVAGTNMSALVLEVSGHGDSPFEAGDIMPAQHFLEVVQAFDWLTEKYPEAKITVVGTSYGGFQAANLSKQRNFDRLILRAPAIYAATDFYVPSKDIDRQWTRSTYRSDAKIIQGNPVMAQPAVFTGKSLVVIHEQDDQVPAVTTEAYATLFKADRYVAEGFLHSTRSMPQEQIKTYQQKIIDWLNRT